MSGSGNDFIIIDNRNGCVELNGLPEFTRRICRRKLSVGADGLILVEKSSQADFKWQFFNSDGSRAEMCGNGARCAARYAFVNGITGRQLRFETDAGIIAAQVCDDQVMIRMTDPKDLNIDQTLKLVDRKLTYSSVNTGVPHVVIWVEDVEAVDVVQMGRQIRRHGLFAPAGTNVNFVSPTAHGLFAIRTYERGVEDETLACGTGNVAAAMILATKQQLTSPVRLKTRSGSILRVHFGLQAGRFIDLHLEGDARIIYRGQLDEEAWNYGNPSNGAA
jgi:diaminopimelate epimerase